MVVKKKATSLSTVEVKKLKEAIKQKGREAPDLIFNPSEFLIKEQLDFINDSSEYSVACCSRRAGKSYSIAALLIQTCLHNPNGMAAYITLSKNSARDIIFTTLVELINKYELDAKINQHEQVIEFHNKAKIKIYGAKDHTEIEKLRGLKLHLACIDEAQSFKHSILHELMMNILPPALGDYCGRLVLTGTPSPRKAGIFYDCFVGNGQFVGYTPFHWTLKHNIYFPAFVSGKHTYDSFIAQVLKTRGITKDDAAFKREYLGIFCEDENSLLYNCPDSSLVESLPSGHEWRFLLGIDSGYSDNDAYSVMAYSPTHKTSYIIRAFEKNNSMFSEMVEDIKRLNDEYNFQKIVIDCTETGLKVAAEINKRYNIRVNTAQKQHKQLNITFLNDDLRMGKLKVVKGLTEDLIWQWQNLTWVYNHIGVKSPGTLIGSKKEDHVSDATLYCYRECRHYMSKEREEEPEEGSEEYYKKVSDARRDELIKNAQLKDMRDRFNRFKKGGRSLFSNL